LKKFELEALGMRSNDTGYDGGFSLTVRGIVGEVINGSVLHLFSGSSKIGDVRVDVSHPNATNNIAIEDFIVSDNRDWDWVVLDPPYKLVNNGSAAPHYDIPVSVSTNVPFRRKLEEYLRNHTDNVLWLDICAPLPKGFSRQKVWFLFPGGYRPLRVLSWLKREIKPML